MHSSELIYTDVVGEEDSNLRSRGSGPRAVDQTGPSPDLAPSRGLEPRSHRLTAGRLTCLGHKGVVPEDSPRVHGAGTPVGLRSSGCKPAALAAELLGNWRWRTVSSRRTRTVSACRSTSELLQRWTRPRESNALNGGSAKRRLPAWPGRACCWHQEKDLNPHLVGQDHGSYR